MFWTPFRHLGTAVVISEEPASGGASAFPSGKHVIGGGAHVPELT